MNTQQRQMLLDLKPEQLPTLDNFVVGANAELVQRLRSLCDKGSFDAMYLWGTQGGGKSHLLAATADAARRQRPVVFLQGIEAGAELALAPGSLLVIDDVQALGAEAQVALFRAFNAARFLGLALLLSGNEPPLRLELREDLRTRIGQTLIYEIQSLSDDEKAAALRRHAIERGMPAFREGKIVRVEAWLESLGLWLGSFEHSWFYSDSHNDLPLLEKVSDPVAVDPDATLEQAARERGWRQISLRG